MTRRTGREGLHARVVEGERRRLEQSRAARRESERNELDAVDDPEAAHEVEPEATAATSST